MLDLNFSPFPILHTERLSLRKLELSDANEIFILRSNENVNKYIDRPKTLSIEESKAFINKISGGIDKNESIYWVISLKGKSKLIGTICFWNIIRENHSAEIGYELHPDFQGMGIMQEAMAKVIDFGFQKMGLQLIEAFTNPNNDRSTRLLKKYNFKRKINDDRALGDNNEKEIIFILSRT